MKLQEQYSQFKALGAEIVAVSVETLEASKALIQHTKFQFPVLADPDHQAIAAYGVFNLLGDSRASPSVFILDQQGVVLWKFVGQHKKDWPSVETILKQLG